MTNKKAPAPTGAHGSIAAPSLSTAGEATQFLELLGKDPATTRLRAFPHKESTNKAKIAARKGEWDLEQAATWNREGRGVFVVTGNGGDKKEDITSCPALFVEWDDQPIEWQLTAWIELGLPEPTMQVPTGGRSVHNWWVMTEPISPAEFEALQIRLYTHCKSDELKDPSRVMRLPGFAYIGPDDKPAGLVELVNVTGNRYSAAEIEACLPALPAPAPAKAVAAVPSRKFTPRSIDEVNAAATFVPRRVGNEGTYESDRNALCGCSAALAEAGHSDPDGAALALLEDKWPPGDARQALKSATTRNAASFWAIAREHGYALKRTSKTSKKSSLPALGRLPRSLLALIQQLGCGLNEKGGPSSLSAGGLAEMLPSHRFLFNELDLRAYVETTEGWQLITDADMVDAYVLLTGMGWGIGKDPVCDAILSVARQTSIHPVRDYLKKVEADTSILPYDLDEVAKAFFRADAKLHRVMVRKWLIGAVWRAFQAGCQMDYCLVLQSEKQGLQKSTSLKALASPEWFCSSVPEGDKDFLLNIHSCWIYELAELESVTGKRQSGHLKNLFTTSVDIFRVPYGRTNQKMPRHSVFCGSVNKQEFLRDDTGNRRYWVVPITGTEKLDRDALIAARDSIWKGAVIAYRNGELPMLPEALEQLSEVQNDEFNAQDAWVGMVEAWMDGDPLMRWNPDFDPSRCTFDPDGAFTSAEILYSAGLRPPNSNSKADEVRLSEVLRSMGFQKTQKRLKGRVSRVWELSQPSQPSQPQKSGVVTPQSSTGAVDLGWPSQPSQPKKLKADEKKQIAVTAHPSPALGERGCDGCDSCDSRSSAAGLSVTTPHTEVVTAPEVVTPNNRQENEQRIRELGHSTDLSGWSDGEVADLVQSLEQAARRQAGSGLFGQEVAP
jgi:hypothetical protein